MDFIPLHFINEPIEVHFFQTPLLEKKPGCPDEFTWRDRLHVITEMLGEWQDNQRRGRMAKNMRPSHAAAAALRGSWGVGQHYFRVRTQEGKIFDIYYDRAPRDAGHRKGAWFIDKELQPAQAG